MTLGGNSRRKTSSEDLGQEAGGVLAVEFLRRRLASAYFAYFVCGWGDGVTGTVLPYFISDFHLSYMTSSLLYAGSTVGFTVGTILIERTMNSLGRFYLLSNKPSCLPIAPFVSQFLRLHSGATGYSASQARFLILVLSSVLHAAYFAIMGSRRGFPSLLVGYAISGLARSYLTASLNSYVASTPKAPLGYLLAFWSIGGFAAPFVCQTVIAANVPWPRFYYGSLVMSAVNTIFLVFSFRPTQKEFMKDKEAAVSIVRPDTPVTNTATSSTVTLTDAPPPPNTLLRTLLMPYQWAFSFFICVLSGSQTTTSGFMVTYLLVVRDANPKTVGYVTSGFWGGQVVGQILWGYFTPSLTFKQKKHVLHACLVIALVMNLLIWLVRSTVENSISTGILGVVYGPMFPGSLVLANDLLPPEVHFVAMAIISAFFSFGSALFPFIVGMIANIKGVHTLSYVAVAQTAFLVCLWYLFPTQRRTDSGSKS